MDYISNNFQPTQEQFHQAARSLSKMTGHTWTVVGETLQMSTQVRANSREVANNIFEQRVDSAKELGIHSIVILTSQRQMPPGQIEVRGLVTDNKDIIALAKANVQNTRIQIGQNRQPPSSAELANAKDYLINTTGFFWYEENNTLVCNTQLKVLPPYEPTHENGKSIFQQTVKEKANINLTDVQATKRGLQGTSDVAIVARITSSSQIKQLANLHSSSTQQTQTKPVLNKTLDYSKMTNTELHHAMKANRIGNKDAPKLLNAIFNKLMGSEGIYRKEFRIQKNDSNLKNYINSGDFIRHQKSTKVYFDSRLGFDEAKKMATEREPVNIANQRYFDASSAKELLGYSESYFQRSKENNQSKMTSIYSETYLWNPPGGTQKKEVAVLSVYAPALDSPQQPQYKNYVDSNGNLNEKAYREDMNKMAQFIVKSAIDNKNSAFDGQGLQRVVISLVGQGAFVNMLNAGSKGKAMEIFQETIAAELKANKTQLEGISIVISEFSGSNGAIAARKIAEKSGLPVTDITGDIKATAKDRDLLINAWDPHSAPGNGNDGDNTFDGQLGRSTGILLTQTNWFNPALNDRKSYVNL